MRVYISGALHGSKDLKASRSKYETLATVLSEKGFSPYLPHMQTDPVWAAHVEPMEVFSHDLQELAKSDIVVAFLDEPSLGVGAEIVIAIQQGIFVLGVYPRGISISRFIEGLMKTSEACDVLEYDTLEEISRHDAFSRELVLE